MAIRIRIAIRRLGSTDEVETTALVNSGYEVEVPEIHLPTPLARKLGFNVEEASLGTITLCGSFEAPLRMLGMVEVRVITEDRSTEWIRALATSIGREAEVLLSDKLTDALGISPIRVGEGLWRFSDEPADIWRTSVEPEYWAEEQGDS